MRDHLGEEVERIGLVLLVSIGAADDPDNAADHLRLGEDLEEALIFTEVVEGLGRVEGHVQVFVLEGQLVDERADDH